MRRGRLIGGLALTVRLLRWGNWFFLGAGLLALLATFVFAVPLEAQIARKYAGLVDVASVVLFLRLLCVLGSVAVWPIERLFGALAAMLETVRIGDPFERENAARLRTVGWSLLALQFVDLVMGGACLWAARHHVDVVGWQPSLTGWLCVLIAFVLAQVFTAGAAMRDDLAGTV